MFKDKKKTLYLLKQKVNGEIIITYHGLSGKPSNNSASPTEIEFIENFKNQYPICSISQFQDIYNEDIMFKKY